MTSDLPLTDEGRRTTRAGAQTIVLRREARPPAPVQVRLVDLDAGPPLALLTATATGEERDRATRYRLPLDRRRYLSRRLHLRAFIGEQLRCRPEAVRFTCGPSGKLHVADGALGASLAHSGGLALLVLGDGLEVGCDLEAVDPGFCWRQVEHADVLNPSEARTLETADPDAARRQFFALWTLKEAALKCLGVGLSVPASSVVIAGDGATEPGEGDHGANLLRACSLAAAPGFAAAVAWKRLRR